jgi:hypothetical protein
MFTRGLAPALGAVILAAACGGGPRATPSNGCDNDLDCSGDRICEKGACVSPGSSSSTTSTSTSSGGGPSGEEKHCFQYPNGVPQGWCRCSADLKKGDTTHCGPDDLPGAPSVCCAKDGWPDVGDCMCDQMWCKQDLGFCVCNLSLPQSTPSFDCKPPQGQGVCCTYPVPHSHSCTCDPDFTFCSGSDSIEVPDCGIENMECGPGYHRVDRCQ